MTSFWKKKQFWGTLIALVLLAYCLKDITLEELKSLGARLNFYYVIPAAASGFLYMLFKGLRWRAMVSRQKKIRFWRAITLYSTGQILGLVMPALTGQVGRLVLFSRKEGLKKTFIFSTIILEVLFDAISLVIFMLITSFAFVFPSEYRHMSTIVAGVTVAALVCLYLMLHYQEGAENFGRKCLRNRWPGAYITVKKFIRSFTKGIEVLKSSQHMAGTMALSLLSWGAHMLVVWYLMKAFGLELPFAAAAVVMIINTIVLMVPITPGNAGTFEVAVSTSLAAFSVGRSDAVLFALALHIMDFIPIFVYSFYFLRLERQSIMDIKEEHEEDMVPDYIDEEGGFIGEDRI